MQGSPLRNCSLYVPESYSLSSRGSLTSYGVALSRMKKNDALQHVDGYTTGWGLPLKPSYLLSSP